MSGSDLFEGLKRIRAQNMRTKHLLGWVDEAGEKGLMRRLREEDDASLGLMCALCVPAEKESEVRRRLSGPFAEFKDTFGLLSKSHITDAFDPKNSAWSHASKIRTDIFGIIKEARLHVVYDACRMVVARRSFTRQQELERKLRELQSERYAFGNLDDRERLERRLIGGLARKVDLLAFSEGADNLDLFFDRMDDQIFEELKAKAAQISSLQTSIVAKGWDREKRKPACTTWTFDRSSDSTPVSFLTLMKLEVASTTDGRIFAADVVTNSLFRHLRELPSNSHLNVKAATDGWILSDCVFANPMPGPEDFV
jgi:hypothetical protein